MAGTSGSDLINLDDDVTSVDFRSSVTTYQEDLKEVNPNQDFQHNHDERNSVALENDPHFQAELQEAIKRSLNDIEGSKCTSESKDFNNPSQEMLLSDDEDFDTLKRQSNAKVMMWDYDLKRYVTPSSPRTPPKQSIDEDEWYTKATPKTMQNLQSRGFKAFNAGSRSFVDNDAAINKAENKAKVPQSSILNLKDTSVGKGRTRDNSNRRSYAETVARTANPEADTVTVSSVRKKRQGRGGRFSYYDITPELQYLR